MNIKEDHVSFEIAKLLKEKGFNEPCYTCYLNKELSHYDYLSTNFELIEDVISAPTHQMTTKWLREIYDLIIYIKLVNDGDLCHNAWGFNIYNKFTNEYIKSNKLWFKYEEACEKAIQYCLKNLI